MLRTILLTLAALLAGVLAFAYTRPASFRVERSTVIDASPEDVYPLLSDFRRWIVWSPWEGLDPAMNRSFSGAEDGVGAVYEWDGNRHAGQGRMEIVEAVPGSHLTVSLDFIRPFESHNTTQFNLERTGESTRLTWAMYGPATFMTRLMTVFVSMDRLIGKDFEAGLASLKAAAEASVDRSVSHESFE